MQMARVARLQNGVFRGIVNSDLGVKEPLHLVEAPYKERGVR